MKWLKQPFLDCIFVCRKNGYLNSRIASRACDDDVVVIFVDMLLVFLKHCADD